MWVFKWIPFREVKAQRHRNARYYHEKQGLLELDSRLRNSYLFLLPSVFHKCSDRSECAM